MPNRDGYYEMMFTCSNCGDVFSVEVSRGCPAKGHGGECPYCGVRDGFNGVNNFGFEKRERGKWLKSDGTPLMADRKHT